MSFSIRSYYSAKKKKTLSCLDPYFWSALEIPPWSSSYMLKVPGAMFMCIVLKRSSQSTNTSHVCLQKKFSWCYCFLGPEKDVFSFVHVQDGVS